MWNRRLLTLMKKSYQIDRLGQAGIKSINVFKQIRVNFNSHPPLHFGYNLPRFGYVPTLLSLDLWIIINDNKLWKIKIQKQIRYGL